MFAEEERSWSEPNQKQTMTKRALLLMLREKMQKRRKMTKRKTEKQKRKEQYPPLEWVIE